jgi:hypothetical protein
MRESTSNWLEPMMAEAETRGIAIMPLMDQAKMPAREVDWQAAGGWNPAMLMPEDEYPGVRHWAIDWIRFGELLRTELGWDHYPEFPEAEQS